MRVLIDKDISKWNKRISNTQYYISINSWSNNTRPSQILTVMERTNLGMSGLGDQLKETTDPTIKYNFTFSLTSNRKDEFFRIHELLLKNGIANQVSYTETHPPFGSKRKSIMIDPKFSLSEETHIVYSREYTRYSYQFDGYLSSIIAYITILEDTIEFFQKLWGYDENGGEVCIIKYPIGTIVSKPNDKSKDYIVISYDFIVDGGEYHIKYIVAEMVSDIKSSIIKYGGIETIKESDLSYSRNNRIDNILN